MATQLFLRNEPADTHLGTDNATLVGGTDGWQSNALGLSRGPSANVAGALTVAGTTLGIETNASLGVGKSEWISPPVSADVTISDTITGNIWASESAMNANAAINVVVDVIRANATATRNSNTIVNIVQSTNVTELSFSGRTANNFTSGMTSGAYTSQSLNRGDRLRIRIIASDAGTMASGFTWDASFGATSAATDGDSYVTFTEDFSFDGPLATTATTNDTFGLLSPSDQQTAQPFVAAGTLKEVRATLSVVGSPSDDLVIEVQTDSSGAPSGSVVGTVATVAGSSLTTSATDYFYACSVALTASTSYWLVYRRSGSLSNTNHYRTGVTTGVPTGWTARSDFSGAGPAWIVGTTAFGVRLAFGETTLYLTNEQSGLEGAPTLISDFTGSDENPLSEGGNWARINSAVAQLQRISNSVSGTAADVCHSYWTPANFGADLEAYFTISTFSGSCGIVCRVQGEGGANTWDGYRVSALSGEARIEIVTNAVEATLVANTSVTWASGDKLGLRIEGSTIQCWRQASGSGTWNLLATVVNTTYASAGKVGILASDTTVRIDDFYAATDSSLFTQKAWTSRGSGVTSYMSATAAGWTAPLLTAEWFTPPLAAFTLTGMAQANIRALESDAAANASLRCEIARVDEDGTNATVWSSWCCAPTGSDNGELTTSEVARTINLSGDDLAFTDGQRIRIRLYNEDISSAAMGASQTVTRFYNGTSGGASGDSYITLPQTVEEFSFEAASLGWTWKAL